MGFIIVAYFGLYQKGSCAVVELNGKKRFPCPVCMDPREVRITKKRKPYIICDPCGIQLFVRGPAGIAALNRLFERGEIEDLWTEPELAKTSLFDGSLQGFRCPAKDCREVVPWKTKE
jgi:hypothetical protein